MVKIPEMEWMDLETFVRRQGELEEAVGRASAALAAIPGHGTGLMGLTPDHVRATPAFREALAREKQAWAALRAFNVEYAPKYARDARDVRRATRMANL